MARVCVLENLSHGLSAAWRAHACGRKVCQALRGRVRLAAQIRTGAVSMYVIRWHTCGILVVASACVCQRCVYSRRVVRLQFIALRRLSTPLRACRRSGAGRIPPPEPCILAPSEETCDYGSQDSCRQRRLVAREPRMPATCSFYRIAVACREKMRPHLMQQRSHIHVTTNTLFTEH